MFTPLEIVGDTARGSTDQKVRGSNPFERAEVSRSNVVLVLLRVDAKFHSYSILNGSN